jgi:sulfide:quinone oxidoreductase
MTYVTPLDAAFTQPVAANRLGDMLERRGIALEADFMVERVDNEHKALVSYDEREVPFDLLVTVPVNMGADFVARSGLGDELNYVPVDKHTLRSDAYENIFALGDASNIPTSKAGSTAHFSVDVFVRNFVDLVHHRPVSGSFDGHATCFVESGGGKALLVDFDYETQPLPGRYPVPVVGPMRLLEETRLNHLGKLAFRHLYWNALLPGHPLPVPSHLSTAGKHRSPEEG